QNDGYLVETNIGTIYCRSLVGADGSSSIVRKSLGLKRNNKVSRLLEILTPCRPEDEYLFDEKIVNLDFTPLPRGLQGYYWDFPSIVNGEKMINRGIFDSRSNEKREKADLKILLKDALLERGIILENFELLGHPLHCFQNDIPISKPHALLVGDAAGADPLFGEGISFALGYGRSAAKMLVQTFRSENFSFSSYSNFLHEEKIFRHLSLRASLSKFAYSIRSTIVLNIGWFLVSMILRLFPKDNPFYIGMKKIPFKN
ncbi:hypothetical protein P3G55_20675, partial [Leptospira sp. 96542]|nr:hypothetical protein [Leptospira sp. 96542]